MEFAQNPGGRRARGWSRKGGWVEVVVEVDGGEIVCWGELGIVDGGD